MSEARLRIGVLGCGQIAQAAHFDACRKAVNAELYAICDAAPDLLERMRLVHQPRVAYADYEAMLGDPAVEAVIVAVADQFHADCAERALAAGKHVLVEKPMAVSVEEAERLRAAVRASGRYLQVGTMKRYDPGIAFARDFLASEGGEILAVKAWYCDSAARYAMTDALQPVIEQSVAAVRPPGDPKADRQRYFLLGHGSHLVDTAAYLGGTIEAVRATHVEKFGAYCWFVEVAFANGAAGHLDLTIPVRMDWHEGFQIYAEHGSAVGKIFNPWYLRSAEVECFSSRDGQYHRVLGADAHFYRLQLEGFAATALTGAATRGATVDDGAAAVRALVAIRRSVASGEWVRLAEVMGSV